MEKNINKKYEENIDMVLSQLLRTQEAYCILSERMEKLEGRVDLLTGTDGKEDVGPEVYKSVLQRNPHLKIVTGHKKTPHK